MLSRDRFRVLVLYKRVSVLAATLGRISPSDWKTILCILKFESLYSVRSPDLGYLDGMEI